MKKVRGAAEAVDSTESLYQNVIALDKSEEAPSSLLDALLTLLELDISEIEACAAEGYSSTSIKSSTQPTSKWAIRWLLHRLTADQDQALELGLDYRAWLLLGHLIQSSLPKVVNQLLKGYDLLIAIERTLKALSTTKRPEDPSHNESDGHSPLHLQVLLPSRHDSKPNGKSKKRKREASAPNSSSVQSPVKVFYHIVRLLGILTQPYTQDITETEQEWGRLPLLTNRANSASSSIKILAHGLNVLAEILEESRQSTTSDVFERIEMNFSEPLISLYRVACRSSSKVGPDDNQFQTQTTLLSSCTLPALRALLLLGSSPISAKYQQFTRRSLENLISQICIHPFRTSALSQTQKARAFNGDSISQSDDALLVLRFDTCGNMSDFDLAQCLHRAFEISFDCVTRDTSSQRAREDPFLQRLATALLVANPNDSRQILTRLVLQTANEKRLVLPGKQLSTIVKEMLPADWSLIALCFTNNANHFATKDAQSIDELFTNASGVLTEADSSDTGLQDTIVQEICIPLARAYESTRDWETFLQFWSKHFEEAWLTGSSGQHECSIWTDECLLATISECSRKSLTLSRRLELLSQWSEGLLAELTGSFVSLQLIVLMDCLIMSLGEDEREDRTEEVMRSVFQSVIPWLSKTCSKGLKLRTPRAHSWRGWLLLSDLIEPAFGHGPVQDSNSLVQLEEMAKAAFKLIQQQFSSGSPEVKDEQRTVEARFAWLFALRSIWIVKKDPLNALTQPWATIISSELTAEAFTSNGTTKSHFRSAKVSEPILDCILTTMEICRGKSIIGSFITKDIVQRSYQILDSSPTGVVSRMAQWHQLGLRIGKIASDEKDSQLLRSTAAAKICAFKQLGKPSKSSLPMFQSVIDNASDLRCGFVEQEDRKLVVDAISAWTQSSVLDKDPSSRGFLSAHELMHRLETGKRTCKACQPQSASSQVLSPDLELIKTIGKQPEAYLAAGRLPSQIHKMVETLKAENETGNGLSELKDLFSEAQRALGSCTNAFNFLVLADITVLMLKIRHLAVVSQSSVDGVLAIITYCTSPSCKLEADEPDWIYQALCHIFGGVLSGYRHRTNGRYHLMMAALEGLLRCLFITQRTGSQPAWATHKHKSISNRSGELFSRLLTSLSDPTVSAARMGGKQSKLNDPTKKARSIAGQHLSQLIIKFCSFQLTGRMDPTLRAKINPGLYSILDAMSKDVMQNMNASMTASERAIFKALYDDWRRFGRWQGV